MFIEGFHNMYSDMYIDMDMNKIQQNELTEIKVNNMVAMTMK